MIYCLEILKKSGDSIFINDSPSNICHVEFPFEFQRYNIAFVYRLTLTQQISLALQGIFN